ncbi:hypothetical protein L1I79_37640, partial [Strepomyces sp. STD 3.1]|nr:hypothetical protein [Streptomyces sp. STD 3.1]
QVKNGNKGTYYERQNIINGEPKELDTKSNFLINVGDMKYDNPSWLLLDTQEEHIIFNILG